MINIQNNIAEMSVGNISIGSAYVGNQLVWEKSSPALPYDAEVEWILSDGGQYIDTGFMMDNSVKSIHSVFRCLDARSSRVLIGNRFKDAAFVIYSAENNPYNLNANFFGSIYTLCKNNTNKKDFTYSDSTGEITIVDMENNSTSTITPSITENENMTLKVFGNTPDHSNYRSYMMFYQAEVETTGGSLQIIPVRAGQTGCLYDKVSRSLFYNLGSGSFILGPDKGTSIPYTQVEYLQSSGTQYINLGIKPKSNELIEIKFQYVGAQSTMVIGCRTSGTAGKFTVGSGTSGTKIYVALGSGANTNLLDLDQNTHSIVINTSENFAFADDGTKTSLGKFSANNLNIYLFAANQNGTVSYQATARIMEVRIGIRMWLVPVRDGQTGYMYDKISKELYGNVGTGSFTYGDDVT